MNSTPPVHVAVVGGGWSGMAAAADLAAHGIPVTVFEAAPVLGGRARRVDHAGVALDNGQHLLLGAYAETLSAIAQVTDLSAVSTRHPLRISVPASLDLQCPRLPAPFHLLAGLLLARGLTLRDRWSAAAFIACQRIRRFRTDPHRTVDELLSAHGQTERICRHLWQPLCVAALNTPSHLADAQTFLTVIRDGLAGHAHSADLVFPAVDLSAMFPEPAARFVIDRGGDIRLNEAVTRLVPDGGRLLLTTPRAEQTFSHVVWATDPARAIHSLDGVPEMRQACDIIRRMAHEPITTVYLHYAGAAPALPFSMVGDEEGPAQWIFDRGALCAQAGWIGAVISAADDWRGVERSALSGLVHRQLERLAGTLPSPDSSMVITEKRATFRCVPALERPAQATPVPGLHLAGDYTRSEYPATLEAAVRSGRSCARSILENL
ncbi:MAG: FAD-dependent oxidoreductase [Betaproteobacteria bacterium]|nr:FAD-dependent oxidoreductase [Betaproteobacteria bacterium]